MDVKNRGRATEAPEAPKPSAKAPATARSTNDLAPDSGALVKKRWQVKDVPAKLTGATGFEAKASATTAPLAAPAGTPPLPGTYPSAADVDRIAAMPDPVARNYAITQGYHDLSNAMGDLLGRENANWSTFATWASKQAGVSIRNEDAPKVLTDALRKADGVANALDKVNGVLARLGLPKIGNLFSKLTHGANRTMDELSAAIGEGNKKVFQEIGKEFAVFADTFRGADHYDQAKVDQYLAHFQPGQERLKEAYGAYAKAMFEKDPNKKAELMLLGNDLIGLHEQTRLQPEIARALNAPVEVMFKDMVKQAVKDELGSVPFGAGKFLYGALEKSGALDKAIAPLTDALSSAWRKVATDQLMKLETPTQLMSLGKDVTVAPGRPDFARDLSTIETPRLRELLGQIDRTPDSLKGSAAKDWASIDDRMNYIGDLFRSGQQDPSLWRPPFGHAGTYPVTASVGAPHAR